MLLVHGFSPGQTTRSFATGAPQRESYNSDADYFRGVKLYDKEWRRTYRCMGCLDRVCPQCGREVMR
jgi:hypothetical protein